MQELQVQLDSKQQDCRRVEKKLAKVNSVLCKRLVLVPNFLHCACPQSAGLLLHEVALQP